MTLDQATIQETFEDKGGVLYWRKTGKKWAVQLSINGRQTNLGRFDDLEFADLVATEARDKYHGAFARHL